MLFCDCEEIPLVSMCNVRLLLLEFPVGQAFGTIFGWFGLAAFLPKRRQVLERIMCHGAGGLFKVSDGVALGQSQRFAHIPLFARNFDRPSKCAFRY